MMINGSSGLIGSGDRFRKEIIVDYNTEEKVHELKVNFKIPVIIGDGDGNQSILDGKPRKSGRIPMNQIEPFDDYSTVLG
ncbi:MAG: hypothetical protein ABR974_12225 [Bacteroidales bacterium]